MVNTLEISKSRRWVAVVPVLVVALLIGVFAKRLLDIQGGRDPSLLQTVLLDTPMPDIDLPPLPNRGEGLATTDLTGHVSLVNVWGSWCIACLSEHPLLMEVAAQNFVPVNGIAWRDDPESSLKWLARNGDPYGRIGQDPVSEAAIALGVTGAPETFIIDAEGVIRYKHIGPITQAVWIATIAPLVESLRR